MSSSITYLVSDAAIYLGMPIGLWVSLRVMAYADLALEQLFVLGGIAFALTATHRQGGLLLAAVLIVTALGLGFSCSMVRNTFRVHPVLVSLIAAHVYYSGGLGALGSPNVFFGDRITQPTPTQVIMTASAIYGILIGLTAFASRSRPGLKVIAAGSNSDLARRHGLAPSLWQGLGLAIGFLFTLVAGSLYAWRSASIDVGSGSGFLLISIFVVFSVRSIDQRVRFERNSLLLLVILVLFLALLQVALLLGMSPHWIRGGTALSLLAVLLLLPRKKGQYLAI